MKNRQFKKNMKKKLASLEEGQGLIISSKSMFTYGDYHYYKIGSVVNIVSLKDYEIYAHGRDKHTGDLIHQYLKPEHIIVK